MMLLPAIKAQYGIGSSNRAENCGQSINIGRISGITNSPGPLVVQQFFWGLDGARGRPKALAYVIWSCSQVLC